MSRFRLQARATPLSSCREKIGVHPGNAVPHIDPRHSESIVKGVKTPGDRYNTELDW